MEKERLKNMKCPECGCKMKDCECDKEEDEEEKGAIKILISK